MISRVKKGRLGWAQKRCSNRRATFRRPDPRDRRGKLIVLTEPGKRLIDDAIGRHVANEERLLLTLSEAEQETLSALLKKLIAGL